MKRIVLPFLFCIFYIVDVFTDYMSAISYIIEGDTFWAFATMSLITLSASLCIITIFNYFTLGDEGKKFWVIPFDKNLI